MWVGMEMAFSFSSWIDPVNTKSAPFMDEKQKHYDRITDMLPEAI